MKGKLKIDPFRQRQVPDVAGRFLSERDHHQRHADLMWTGTLALFSDHELRLLSDLGYLAPHDLDLLRRAGRWPWNHGHAAEVTQVDIPTR